MINDIYTYLTTIVSEMVIGAEGRYRIRVCQFYFVYEKLVIEKRAFCKFKIFVPRIQRLPPFFSFF